MRNSQLSKNAAKKKLQQERVKVAKYITIPKMRKRSDRWFKQMGSIRGKDFNPKQVRYIVERTIKAMPQSHRKYIDNEVVKNALTQNILLNKEQAIDVHKVLKSTTTLHRRRNYDETHENLFRQFRLEHKQLYNKYNSMMYRSGESAVNFFRENKKTSMQGSTITVEVDLPPETGYHTLIIEYDYSGQDYFVNLV